MVCSCAPHSQAAEEVIPHLCKQERKRLTSVWRRLSRSQGLLGIEPDPGSSWEGHSDEMGAGVGDKRAESCRVVLPVDWNSNPMFCANPLRQKNIQSHMI